MVTNPQIVEKTLKAQAAKKSKVATKRKSNAEESNDEGAQKEIAKEKKKKQKQRAPTPGMFPALIFGLSQCDPIPDSEDGKDKPAVEITVYVYIEKPPLLALVQGNPR